MNLNPKSLEIAFAEGTYGLSARRLWEHTNLGQINPFGIELSQDSAAADFIDVIRLHDHTWSLAGVTLAQLRRCGPPHDRAELRASLQASFGSESVSKFERQVSAHLAEIRLRVGHRTQEGAFLRPTKAGPFGVPFLYSRLQERLRAVADSRLPAVQWHRTVENMRQRGLRADELDRSGLLDQLRVMAGALESISGKQLAMLCDFGELKLSVIPVVGSAAKQLRFVVGAPRRRMRAARVSRRDSFLQRRSVAFFDPSLGYRIEQVQQEALWGTDTQWQAVAPNGQTLSSADKTAVLTPAAAAETAAKHAAVRFPKTVALGRWGYYAWAGGENYREWLITLPNFPLSFISNHFGLRNVLAHIRCDVRESAEGEHVLLLHEVQSDWAQGARRRQELEPPFASEWTSLALKLALLHAAYRGLDAVAWTQGSAQVQRYGGQGAAGLLQLYDRTLPQDATRILKPWSVACGRMDIYVPMDFNIRQTEDGYEVLSSDNQVLGTSRTFEGAQQLLPDGAHETLHEVHAVRLSKETRQSVLTSGLPAWGYHPQRP